MILDLLRLVLKDVGHTLRTEERNGDGDTSRIADGDACDSPLSSSRECTSLGGRGTPGARTQSSRGSLEVCAGDRRETDRQTKAKLAADHRRSLVRTHSRALTHRRGGSVARLCRFTRYSARTSHWRRCACARRDGVTVTAQCPPDLRARRVDRFSVARELSRCTLIFVDRSVERARTANVKQNSAETRRTKSQRPDRAAPKVFPVRCSQIVNHALARIRLASGITTVIIRVQCGFVDGHLCDPHPSSRFRRLTLPRNKRDSRTLPLHYFTSDITLDSRRRSNRPHYGKSFEIRICVEYIYIHIYII